MHQSIYCFNLQMLAEICQPSPNLRVYKARGSTDEGPTEAHGYLHPQLASPVPQKDRHQKTSPGPCARRAYIWPCK